MESTRRTQIVDSKARRRNPALRRACWSHAMLLILTAALVPALAPAQVSNAAHDSEMRLVKARALPLENVRLTGGTAQACAGSGTRYQERRCE